jgi:hypothetical protein
VYTDRAKISGALGLHCLCAVWQTTVGIFAVQFAAFIYLFIIYLIVKRPDATAYWDDILFIFIYLLFI